MKNLLNNLFIPVIAFVILFFGCTKPLTKADGNIRQAGDQNTAYLLKLLKNTRTDSLRTLYANFNIEGYADKQNFKTGGYIHFSNNPEAVRIVFQDAVFKSSITEIVRSEDTIKIYFPLDKTIYVDNINKINIKEYSGLDLDINLITDLSYGRVPVIKDYSIVKGLESGSEPGSGDIKYIILENNEYYETISFKHDVVDKILWMNKNTRDKTEIYLDNPLENHDILFYRSVKIISLKNKLKITVNFSGLKINLPVDTEKLTRLNLPKDVKIINKN